MCIAITFTCNEKARIMYRKRKIESLYANQMSGTPQNYIELEWLKS